MTPKQDVRDDFIRAIALISPDSEPHSGEHLVLCRGLVDTGSQASSISEALLAKHNALSPNFNVKPHSKQVQLFDGRIINSIGIAHLEFHGYNNNAALMGAGQDVSFRAKAYEGSLHVVPNHLLNDLIIGQDIINQYDLLSVHCFAGTPKKKGNGSQEDPKGRSDQIATIGTTSMFLNIQHTRD